MAADSCKKPLSQLLEGISAKLRNLAAREHYRALCDDSRKVGPGDIYLAIAGNRSDGHAFVASAAQQGAIAHIVEASALAQYATDWADLPLIVVDDTRALRPQLAGNDAGWPHRSLQLVGITGTNGKTTVTHLLSQIWQAAKIPSARLGTTSNRIDTQHFPAALTTPFPIELQRWLGQAKAAKVGPMAMEVSSHAIAQGRSAQLSFRAVALTSFSQDHLDFHDSMREYLEVKCQLTQQLAGEDSVAVAPVMAGAPAYEAGAKFLQLAKARGARALGLSVGPHPDAQVFCSSYRMHPQGISAQVHTPQGDFELASPLVGLFNLENLLCASAIALDMGMPVQTLAEALPHCLGAPGRLEAVRAFGAHAGSRAPLGDLPTAHVDYAHTPDAESRAPLGDLATAHVDYAHTSDADTGSRAPASPGDLPAVYVDYAHTPDAVRRASAALADQHHGQLIVVLGCGGDRDRNKRPLMAKAALEHCSHAIFSSDNPRTEDPEAILDDMVQGLAPGAWERICDRRQAIVHAISMAGAGDRVLIAGKGHEDYQIIGDQRLDFDDRIEAAKALEAKAHASSPRAQS